MNDLANALFISIFISFPEVILIMMIGFGLCGINLPIRKIMVVSVIQTIFAFVVILVNTPFGLHTIIQLVSLLILVVIIFRISFLKAIVPILIGSFVDTACQTIFVVFDLFYTIDFEKMGHEFFYTFPICLILFAILLIIFIIIKKKKLTLCSL